MEKKETMKASYAQILSTKSYHAIVSVPSKHFYIDRQNRCYLYENESDAKAFCETQPDKLSISQKRQFNLQKLLIKLFNMGAAKVKVKTSDGISCEIPIEEKDVPLGYYNPVATYNILRLLQTGEKKYLRELKNCDFLAACYVPNRKTGEYPKLHYAYATIPFADGKEENFLLLFTTINSFQKWTQLQPETVFSPIRMSIARLRTTVGATSLMFNPGTEELLLTADQANKIYDPKPEN